MYSKNIIFRTCAIASLAGLLFGLDIAYVNGSLDLIRHDFNLTVGQSELIAGYLLMGAAVGALCSGWLSNKFGRKNILLLSSAIFSIFTLSGVLAQTIDILLYSRFIIGIAVGIASFIAPLYLSEIAPYKIRGGIIALYQLMITVGILIMFLSNYALASTHSWRIMMAVILIPAVLMFIGCWKLPESPRWLVLTGKPQLAEKVLNQIRGNANDVKFELNEITLSLQNARSVWHLLNQSFFWKVLILGVLLQALQQFSGMNAFMYYSASIFAKAGLNDPFIATITVGIVNVLTTLIAIKYIDKLGRKPILYFGLSLLVLSCAIVGYIFHLQNLGVLLSTYMKDILFIFCLFFIFGFSISLGPVVWILCSEIYPLEGRDMGITFSTMANWICNAILGSYTLTWFREIGISNTFWIFGGVSLLGFLLVRFFTPETKGVTLEEIEINLKAGKSLSRLGDKVT